MNKSNLLVLSGLSMAAAGAVMIFSENIGIETSKILIPVLFLAAGITTFLFAGANGQNSKASAFHKIQGVLFIIFAGVVAFVPDSLTSFLLYVVYFSLIYGLIEIVFSFSILSSKGEIKMSMLIYRFISGFINSIGAMILLLTTLSDEFKGLQIAGALSIAGGILTILFANKVKNIVAKSASI